MKGYGIGILKEPIPSETSTKPGTPPSRWFVSYQFCFNTFPFAKCQARFDDPPFEALHFATPCFDHPVEAFPRLGSRGLEYRI